MPSRAHPPSTSRRGLTFHDRGLFQVMRQEVEAGVGAGGGQGARAGPYTHPAGAAGPYRADETPEAPGPAPGALVSRLRMLLRRRRQPGLVPHVDGDVVETVLEANRSLPAHRRATAPGAADQAPGLARRPGPRLRVERRRQLAGRRRGLVTATQDAAAAPFTTFPERHVLH